VASELEPTRASAAIRHHATRRWDGFLPAFHPHPPGARSRHAPLGGHVTGFSDAKMTRAGDWYQESIKDTVHCWNTTAM
jgi:aspartate carbamoyltransferase catalytic subunit